MSPWQVFGTILVLLVVPSVLGMGIAHRYPAFAARARKPFRILSLAFFAVFVVGGLVANSSSSWTTSPQVALFVFLLNALALALGYYAARLARLPEARPSRGLVRGRHPELRLRPGRWSSISSAASAAWRSSRRGGASGT